MSKYLPVHCPRCGQDTLVCRVVYAIEMSVRRSADDLTLRPCWRNFDPDKDAERVDASDVVRCTACKAWYELNDAGTNLVHFGFTEDIDNATESLP